MNPTEAKKLAAIALAACPDRASFLDAAAVRAMGDAWAMLLKDVPYAEGGAALKRFLATDPGRLPSPGHIRQIADEARHGRARTGAAAWEDVRREIGATGRYREPSFADPVVAGVVRGLGWRELCDSENATADRARFIDAYEKQAAHAAQDRSVSSLPGIARPALPEVEHAHALRDAERRALSPARDGEVPAENLSPREASSAVAVGAALKRMDRGAA